MPSEVYWGGLGTWSIRRLDLSIAEYGRRIDTFRSTRLELDDDHNPVVRSEAMWAALPDAPADFLQTDTDLALTFDEADFLVERIRHRHPDSLFAEVLSFPGAAASALLPWHVDGELLSDRMRGIVRHAEAASELTTGAQDVYNLLLAERAQQELGWDTDALQDAVRADLANWGERISGRPDLRDWAVNSLGDFWRTVEWRGPMPKPTRDFVSEAVRMSASDPGGLADNLTLRQMITYREQLLKRSRARLGPRSALESWDQVRFGAPLVYRWPTVRSYLRDIADAFEPVLAEGAA